MEIDNNLVRNQYKRENSAGDGGVITKKKRFDLSLLTSIVELEKMFDDIAITVRLRNVTDDREIKIGNKISTVFHTDGFDKKGDAIRISFFDKMVKKWENDIQVIEIILS